MHQHGIGSQAAQPDDVLQHAALVFQGAATQFNHQRFAFEVFDVGLGFAQHFRDEVMAVDNVALRVLEIDIAIVFFLSFLGKHCHARNSRCFGGNRR